MQTDSINGPVMSDGQIKAYLERIEVDYSNYISPEYLKELQYAHITHIPFENTDIMNGVELSLDREHLFKKIILGRRGGVCSELNTLYNWLLESLGFNVESYISRICARSMPLQANSHRIMAVRFDECKGSAAGNIDGSADTCVYITDVGFNYDHHRIPILLREGIEQSDGECLYRFERDDFLGWILYQKTSEGWRRKISFNESRQADIDFAGPTFYAQHHPDSRINKALKASIHKNGAFYAIREGTFLTEECGMVREIEKLTEGRQRDLLKDFFGLGRMIE